MVRYRSVPGWLDLDEPPQSGDDLQLPGGVAVGETAADRRLGVGVGVGQCAVADDVTRLGAGLVNHLPQPARLGLHQVAGPEDTGGAFAAEKAGLAEQWIADAEPVRLLRRRNRGHGELRRQPMTYEALRAVLRRANEGLGTNWSMHDLRHTCALRMLHDKNLNLRDVQVILGHAHLTTTQVYLEEDDDEVIRRVHQHVTAKDVPAPQPSRSAVPDGDAEADLGVLLGEVRA